MTDRADLFRAVAHHPDEMTPRLMLADWLGEQPSELDQARGEFIRLQIDLDDNPPADRDLLSCTRDPRELRERELVTKYAKRWLAAEFPAWAAQQLANAVEWSGHPFTRGFVEYAQFHPLSFVARGHDLFDRTPLVGLEFSVKNLAALHRLVACPHLARVRSLDVWGRGMASLGNRGAEILAECPFLGNLETLDLWQAGLTDAGLAVLARSTAFPELRELDVPDSPFTLAGLEMLLSSPLLPRLEVIRQNTIPRTDANLIWFGERYPDRRVV